MSAGRATTIPVQHADRFFIGGEWVAPSSDATVDVIDSGTEEVYYTIAAAAPDDMSRAVGAARHAFDDGPWARLTHAQRAEYIAALGEALKERNDVLAQLWPRESGVLYKTSQYAGRIGSGALASYAALADTFPFEEECAPTGGGKFGLLVREPVGVVGAIIPWNAPVALICHKIGPALLAGCTVVLKSAPEAPGEGYVFAEAAEQIGLPPGVLNVVTADREVSELLVTDARVDKITFTGSTAAGRRIASLCGERIARCTLELGGKSAAVVLDDMDLATAASTLAKAECGLNGQVCSSLTRVIVTRNRHDEFVEALADSFGADESRRSVRRGGTARAARLGTPTRPRARLHRQGRRRGRDARDRWRSPRGSRPRLLRAAHGLRQRRQRIHDRARRDLRAGPRRHPRSRRTGRGPDRERLDLRTQRVGVHERRRPGACGRAASSGRGPSATTRSAPTSAWRSAASSSRASVGRAARKASCRSWRPRR